MVFGSFLYRENRNLPFRNPLVNAATSILSSASLIERAFFVETGYVGPQRFIFPLLNVHQACSGLFIPVSPNEVRGELDA